MKDSDSFIKRALPLGVRVAVWSGFVLLFGACGVIAITYWAGLAMTYAQIDLVDGRIDDALLVIKPNRPAPPKRPGERS